MGWSTTAPSGVSWSSWEETAAIKLNYLWFKIKSRVARGKNNTIYVAVQLIANRFDYNTTGATISAHAEVAVGSGSYSSSSTYSAGPFSFSTDTVIKTVYYTGTAASGASIKARGYTPSRYTAVNSHTAPAYTSAYTVTLNRNGGSGGTASVTATYGAAMPSVTAPTRAGYTFNGYFTASSGGTKYYNANGTSAKTCDLSANVTLYAQWTANTYAVALDAQSGSGGTASVTATYGAAMPAVTPPTRTGYTFGGYFTGTDGSGTQYYSAAGASVNNWAVAGAATLYALWTADTYTVDFDPQGGTACESISVRYDAPYGALPTPTLANYTFTGWFTLPEGGTQITAASTVAVTDDQTLYAHWTLNAVAITYYGNGAGATGVPAAQDKLIGATATISAVVPTRTGFTFLDWNTIPNGSGTRYSGGDTYSTDAPLDLYAQWAAVPTVTDITAVRCDSTGITTDTDADTYAAVGFRWAADAAVTGAAYTIRWVNREDPTNAGSVSGVLSGASGTVAPILCGAAAGSAAAIETAYQYDVTVTVTDSNGGAGTGEDFVSRAYYVLDFTAGGMGIGIGAPATDGRITTGLGHTADAEERGAIYEKIHNATDDTLLRILDWDGNETLLGALTAGGEIEDGSGNVLSEKADSADTYTKSEIDARIPADAHPVDSIYLSVSATSPASLFGGTWERITGRFLLAATDGGSSGASQAAGNTGGEAAHKLTGGESGQKALTITGGAHTHSVKYRNDLNTATTGSNRRFGPYADASSGSQYTAVGSSSETHTHSVSASDAASAHNNMPPYLAVYVWKRIA
ncbi:MAG: InlB B-repeat-containing protein [Oscillibacter sp.]|nr:InlB B-repeat-containing protein [Oscillibacter sp.]